MCDMPPVSLPPDVDMKPDLAGPPADADPASTEA